MHSVNEYDCWPKIATSSDFHDAWAYVPLFISDMALMRSIDYCKIDSMIQFDGEQMYLVRLKFNNETNYFKTNKSSVDLIVKSLLYRKEITSDWKRLGF